MPKVLRTANLGNSGLNTDVSPWDLPAEFITDGRNFRVEYLRLSTTCPAIPYLDEGVGSEFGHVHANGELLFTFSDTDVNFYDGDSSEGSILHYASLDPAQWTAVNIYSLTVFNHPTEGMWYFNQSLNPAAQPVPFKSGQTWNQSSHRAEILRAHKNFLFALKVDNEQTSYRWSHPADINSLPPSWDETDLAFLAGKSQVESRIIDGLSLRDAFVIYSEDMISFLEPTSDTLVWRRRELTTSSGLLASNCIVEVLGRHYYLAAGDIMMNDGNSVKSIIHNRIKSHLAANISTTNYENAFAFKCAHEIWFCVPTHGQLYPNLAYVYDWQDDSWAIRDLPHGTTDGVYANVSQPDIEWDDADFVWEGYDATWGSEHLNPFEAQPVGMLQTGKVKRLDPPNGGVFETYLERDNFAIESQQQVTTIVRVYPHIEGLAPVRMRFGSHDHPGSPIRWKPWLIFNPLTDRKVDIRTTGELHAWRIESIDEGFFSISGMDIEYEPAGFR